MFIKHLIFSKLKDIYWYYSDVIILALRKGERGSLLSLFIVSHYHQYTLPSNICQFTFKNLLFNRSIQVDNKTIKAQIWDTAGQERYRAITSA